MVFAWLIEGGSEEAIEQFNKELNKPPANATKAQVAQDPMWDKDAMANSFMAQFAARGGGGRTTTNGTVGVS